MSTKVGLQVRKSRKTVKGRSKTRRKEQQKQLTTEALTVAGASDEHRRAVLAMLAAHAMPSWRTENIVPAGSFLETVAVAFEEGTDIPTEIPVFVALNMVAAHCLAKGVKIKIDECQSIHPTIWTVILADSGAGKTWTIKQLTKATNAKLPKFPGANSAAKYVEMLEQHNGSVWFKDEFGKFMRSMSEQTSMAELKDYLLFTYDGEAVSRYTVGRPDIVVEDPALCICGFSVTDTWLDELPAGSLLDGLAQRFNTIVAKPNDRVMGFYSISSAAEALRHDWTALADAELHSEYVLTEGARQTFDDLFVKAQNDTGIRIPKSFRRRIQFSALRYALIYHLLLGKRSRNLDADDVMWAWQPCKRHLADAAWLLGEQNLSHLQAQMFAVEKLVKKARAEGRVPKAREIVANVHSIKRADEARGLLRLVLEGDPEASEAERVEAEGKKRAPSLSLVR